RRRELASDAERQAKSQVHVFTVPQLRALWFVMDDFLRLLFLLGLNCGFTQRDLATLLRSHCHLDGERPFISRHRNKTDVRGKWRLWPETAALLRKCMAKANDQDLALLRPDGRPLVYDCGTVRSDAVQRDWRRVMRECNESLREFHALRGSAEQYRGVK